MLWLFAHCFKTSRGTTALLFSDSVTSVLSDEEIEAAPEKQKQKLNYDIRELQAN